MTTESARLRKYLDSHYPAFNCADDISPLRKKQDAPVKETTPVERKSRNHIHAQQESSSD
jgi:hypothetical protein